MTLTWHALGELDAYQVTDIPRRIPPKPGDVGRTQRIAALIAAYHAAASSVGTDGAGALAVGWIRPSAGGPIRVLTAGDALVAGAPPEGRGEVLLTMPGGARAEPLPPGALTGLMSRLPAWRAIGGTLPGPIREGGGPPPSMEECLLAVWPGPFGWLLVAEPLTAGQIAELADEVARRDQLAAADSKNFAERAVVAPRLQLRHAELRAATSTGLWRVRLLAGGDDAAAAARVAGLVCASADLTGLPYVLAPVAGPARGPRELLEDLDPAPAGDDAALSYPFLASTELVAAVSRPPEREVPGVRLTTRPDFDVTQEPMTGRDAVDVGEILDSGLRPAGRLMLPLAALNRHVLVCGAPGSGKSQTVRTLLQAATGAGIPWLVIEPSKASIGAPGRGGVVPPGASTVRIRVGESDAVAAGLNPLVPAPDEGGRRFPLQTHADLVKALFVASFRGEEPLPQVISAALTRAYEDAGWDLALGETVAADTSPRYPDLIDLQRAAERVVREIDYSQRVADDVLGFIRVRLSTLRLGTSGRFLEGGHQIDFGALLGTNAVLEIEDVADDAEKAFLIGTVLIRLAEHLRMTNRGKAADRVGEGGGFGGSGPRHLTVIEEAHRLLRGLEVRAAGGPAARSVEVFAGLLAEIGCYGEGLIIAEQIPDRLASDVVKNTAVKIAHRLPAADDREAMAAAMNMTGAQSRFLVALKPGEAAVFADGMDHPLLARMSDGTGREGSGSAGSAVTVSPAAVVQPRSATCGADCIERPCTLRDMRIAERALEEYPAIRLWAELSVLAHLTGWPIPVPRTGLLSLMQMMPARLRDCAISHGVDTAVSARVPVIAARVSPVGLAEHVSTAIRSRMSHGVWLCQQEEPKWLAPAYKWTLVLDALKSFDRKSAGAGATGATGSKGPHPRSAEWERTYGQVIGGDTCARQVGTVQRWYDAAQRDAWEVRAVAFGVDSRSAIETAIGASAEDDDFEDRLTGHLDQFVDCRWPGLYLTGDALGDPPERY